MTRADIYRRMGQVQNDMAMGRITAIVAEVEMRKLEKELLTAE